MEQSINCCAAFTRIVATYTKGVIPVVCLKACVKWLALKLSNEASSTVRILLLILSFMNLSTRDFCQLANPPRGLYELCLLCLVTVSKLIA